MRPGGGKAKGAEFERYVCKKLSLWLSNGQQEDVLWRSAMSGGRSTVAARKGKRLAAQAGDISCIHRCGQWFTDKYLIECKTYRDLQFSGLLTGKGKLVEFWSTASLEADRYGKYPLLIAKQNSIAPFVCMRNSTLDDLNLRGYYTLHCQWYDLYIIRFEDFLSKAVR